MHDHETAVFGCCVQSSISISCREHLFNISSASVDLVKTDTLNTPLTLTEIGNSHGKTAGRARCSSVPQVSGTMKNPHRKTHDEKDKRNQARCDWEHSPGHRPLVGKQTLRWRQLLPVRQRRLPPVPVRRTRIRREREGLPVIRITKYYLKPAESKLFIGNWLPHFHFIFRQNVGCPCSHWNRLLTLHVNCGCLSVLLLVCPSVCPAWPRRKSNSKFYQWHRCGTVVLPWTTTFGLITSPWPRPA